MKKKLSVLLCLSVIAVSLFLCSSCDFGGLTGNGGTTTTKSKKEVETKIELSDAIEKYDEETVKGSDISLDIVATVYNKIYPRKPSHSVGALLTAERIENEGKHYFSAELTPSEESDTDVAGLLTLLSQGQETVVKSILSYASDFLTDKIDLMMEMGEQDGVYNLLATYKNKNKTEEGGNIWYVADETTLSKWMNSSSFELPENQVSNFLMKSLYSGLSVDSSFYSQDNASEYVNKNGTANYDITLKKTTGTVVSLLTSILTGTGLNNIEAIADYQWYIDTVSQWIAIKTAKVDALVSKAGLPDTLKNNIILDINIPFDSLKDVIDRLAQNEIIAIETRTLCFTLIQQSRDIFTGTTASDTDCIGISVEIDMDEDFYYDDSQCSLSKKNPDLYLGMDEKAEGRLRLSQVLAGYIFNLEDHIETILSNLDETYKDKIADIRKAVNDKLDELRGQGQEKFNAEDLEKILIEVLLDFALSKKEEETPSEGGNVVKDKISDFIHSFIGG